MEFHPGNGMGSLCITYRQRNMVWYVDEQAMLAERMKYGGTKTHQRDATNIDKSGFVP